MDNKNIFDRIWHIATTSVQIVCLCIMIYLKRLYVRLEIDR